MKTDRKICVGQITGAHGVRGWVRLRSFTEDPESIAAYDLTDEDGEGIDLELEGQVKDQFIASIKNVKNRDDAEALRGTKLFVARTRLPKTRTREYYEVDLVGLEAFDDRGQSHGTVLGVHNYGAGTFLEIGKTRKAAFMLPFSDACVPEVELDKGRIQIHPPENWLKEEKPEKPEKQP